MKTILLLSRDKRLADLFYQIAKNLTPDYRVVATIHTYTSIEQGINISHSWKTTPNLIVEDMAAGIMSCYCDFIQSGQDLSEKVSSIEKELGLTLYKSASNYLYYRRFSKAYYKFWDGYCSDESKMLEEFLGSYLFFKRIFKTYMPSLVFFETQDLLAHRVAAALAYNHGVFVTANSFDTIYDKNRVFLTCGSERRNILLEHFYSNPHLILEESLRAARGVLQRFRNYDLNAPQYISEYRKQTKESLAKKVWINRRKLFKSGMSSTVHRTLNRSKNIPWLEKVMKTSLPEKPYVLFLLHHQPEVSISMAAPRWNDQNAIAEQLAANAPAGLKIVVKENPKTYGLRGKMYFGPLVDYPNIHLLHPEVDAKKTFENALIVLTISGSAGLEGLLMRRRVAVLGRPFYSFFEGTYKLNYPDEIFQCLSEPFPVNADYDDRLQLLAAGHIQSTFPIGNNIPGEPWPETETGGAQYAAAISTFFRIVERDGLKPSQFKVQH